MWTGGVVCIHVSQGDGNKMEDPNVPLLQWDQNHFKTSVTFQVCAKRITCPLFEVFFLAKVDETICPADLSDV